MTLHPSLKELNTRVWLKRFDSPDRKATLDDIPAAYWDYLAEAGIDYVWLMGIWETTPESVEKYCFDPGLIQSYREALPDWQPDDVIGSPYAIDRYQVNPQLGSEESLQRIRSELHERGMRLILDFVPNHFNALSSLILAHPDVFLQAGPDWLAQDPHTFYRPDHRPELVLAHGRDPYFPAWQDTAQINIAHPTARTFMTEVLVRLSDLCDGVRCDMAMLLLNRVFRQTWSRVLPQELPQTEFWQTAIAAVKARRPDFLFMAEAYWDTEWELQQLGFDYTYDKRLTDRLKHEPAGAIRTHLAAGPDFQRRSVRFLENHDEERILSKLSMEQACSAAVVAYTLQGMRFFHEGQWEGKRTRLPVQLGREPEEDPCPCTLRTHLRIPAPEGVAQPGNCSCKNIFYDRLLPILREPVFKQGTWQMLEVEGPDKDDILAWQWHWQNDWRIVVVNYSPATKRGQIPLVNEIGHCDPFVDLLNGHTHPFRLHQSGRVWMDLTLPPFKSRILGNV